MLNFYIDSSSSEIIELGSISYPYKSLLPVASEVLNYFSHTDSVITIYIKENTDAYIEDDKLYLINITSVTFKSYSEVSDSPSRGTIFPTRITQSLDHSKTRFHILQNAELRLTDAINGGALEDYDKLLIGSAIVTITAVRSNVYLYNINARRDIVDYEHSAIFLYLIYLQDKWIDIQYADFNVTGLLLTSPDPINVRIEHILVDAYALRNGIVFRTICNYPEATLDNVLIVNDVTYVTASERQFLDIPSPIYYAGTGNVTATNMSFRDHYSSLTNPKGTFLVSITSDCQPNDGLVQTVKIDNGTFSLAEQATYPKYTLIGVFSNENLYRQFDSTVTNLYFYNISQAGTGGMLFFGTFNDKVYIENVHVFNCSADNKMLRIAIIQSAILNNITFESMPTDYDYPHISIEGALYTEVHDVTFIDCNGTTSYTTGLLSLANIYLTYTLIEQIKVQNSYLNNRSILKNNNALDSMTVMNGEYNQVYQSTGGELFATGTIKQLNFQNHTFSEIQSIEDGDTSSSILNIEVLDMASSLDSTIKDIFISNSEASFLVFGSFMNTPTVAKSVLITTVEYRNSSFDSQKSIINTEAIELNEEVSLIFTGLVFDNIQYLAKGNLLNLMHQLPISITISDSSFTNLKSAKITVESSNKQNTDLKARVKFKNTVFDSINDEYNSLININEGGYLEIENCTFTNIMSFEEGAVLFAGFKETTTIITNSQFFNNSAEVGALFMIEDQSLVECHNCTIYQNMALSAAVAYESKNGYVKFFD